ncbi:MAG: cytidylate kinase family protein [archaeon]
MIITISGTAGSGKTSVAIAIAKKLGYTYYGAGEIRRRYALDHSMSLERLNELSESDPGSDRMVDEHMRVLAEHDDNIVVDGRVAFLFMPRSIKVFIDAGLEVRAKRIMDEKRPGEEFKSLEEAKNALQKRQLSDVKRYHALYGIDAFDAGHYDLIIDNTSRGVDAVAGEIYRFAMFKANELNQN